MNGGRIKPGEVRNPRGLGGPKRKTREAYEHAMEILNNRPGISDSADLAVVRNYDGPVIVGKSPMQPDPERGIPADLQRIAHAIAGESDDHCWADVFNAALQALLAERERAARITIEKGGEWLELAQAIAAAIRDHSGREK